MVNLSAVWQSPVSIVFCGKLLFSTVVPVVTLLVVQIYLQPAKIRTDLIAVLVNG